MNTLTHYRLWYKGQFHVFQTEREALEEKLYMEMMYNVSPPLERVEEHFVDEQSVAIVVTRR